MPYGSQDGLLVGSNKIPPDHNGEEVFKLPEFIETQIKPGGLWLDDEIPGAVGWVCRQWLFESVQKFVFGKSD